MHNYNQLSRAASSNADAAEKSMTAEILILVISIRQLFTTIFGSKIHITLQPQL